MSVNVHEEMNNSINILLDSKKHVEDYEYAFDIIEEYVDNIDYANGTVVCILYNYNFCVLKIFHIMYKYY